MALFNLGEAFRELTSSVGAKDTALAGAKLVGKTLFNTGKLTFEAAIKQNEKTSGKILQRDDLTDEQREKYEKIHEKSKAMRIEGIDSRIEELNTEIKMYEKKLFKTGVTPEVQEETREKIASLTSEKNSLESDKRWST